MLTGQVDNMFQRPVEQVNLFKWLGVGAIFEDALGLKQSDLSSITFGFNRGRIVTFKLKQQIDVDRLYEKELYLLPVVLVTKGALAQVVWDS